MVTRTKIKTQANSISVSPAQFKVLTALKSSSFGLTYKQISKKVGFYNSLTAMLRPEWEGSLGAKGFITEGLYEIGNRDALVFTITNEGKKALKKASKVKLVPHKI